MNQFRTSPFAIQLVDGKAAPREIQLLRTGVFTHPVYGELEITSQMFESMIKNFSENVRKIDIAIDFSHESDKDAAAWVKRLFTLNEGTELWAEVAWTIRGKEAVEGYVYRYTSADFVSNYVDAESGSEFGPTLQGAGLTNRPFIKGMASIVELTEKPQGVKKMNQKELQAENLKLKDEKKALELKLSTYEEDAKKLKAAAEASAPGATSPGADGEKKADPVVDPSAAVAAKKKKLEDMVAAKSPEELMAVIEQLEAQLEAMKAEQSKVADETKLAKACAEKKDSFNKLLSEGKVVEAQRDAFMKDDTIKFAELAGKVDMQSTGSGSEKADKDSNVGATPASDQITEMAEKLFSEKKAKDLGTAMSIVLRDPKNAKLRLDYEIEAGMKVA